MPGLYLHIPFCEQKCHYCNFVISLDRREEFRSRFFKALEHEIQNAVREYGRMKFDTVYWGGGTPSLMTQPEIERISFLLQENFDIAPGAEWTCEFNPGDADLEKIKIFKTAGINRASLGVQAFQDSHLKAAGRKHSVMDTYLSVQDFRKAGIMNVSCDLISGLPGQSLEEFCFNLREIVRLEASQLSFYDLEIHGNTAWGRKYLKSGSAGDGPPKRGQSPLKADLLSEEGREAFFQAAIEIMTAAGYRQYEVSTFAKPGFESRHNLIYWNNQEYLGLGPGAYSYLRGIRSQFAPDVPRYLAKSEKKEWKPDLADVLSTEQKEKETLLTALRLESGLDLERIPKTREYFFPKMKQLAEEGLLKITENKIFLTPRGRFLVESIFRFLLS